MDRKILIHSYISLKNATLGTIIMQKKVGVFLEVTRYINNEKISGDFPPILLENRSVALLFQEILRNNEKESEVC